ncbi:SprT-like domain-containing protein [Alkalicoccobacillus gibsonii]|uniref:SprT-like domain-containing protein n=1 Tax=Alkalicoccobacillus gibsonii TaxID=79881 RepID=UPI0035127A35
MSTTEKPATPVNIERMTNALHELFRRLNNSYFGGKLPTPAITIESKGKRQALGWCSVDAIWKGEDVEYHEIGMASEHIDRPFLEVATTLLHEMVHLHNALNGIKDTSRGYTYHNKRFKTQCEKFGMVFTMDKPHDKYGWFNPSLSATTVALIENYDVDTQAFNIARIDFTAMGEGKKKQTSWKWQCGCNTICRTSKPDFNAICGDCGTKFINVGGY